MMRGADRMIFFTDLDGTLLNTLEDLTDSVNYVMAQYGLSAHTIEEIRSFVGNGAAKLIERSVPQGRQNPLYEEMLETFRGHYAAHCEDKVAPYEGVMELLASLQKEGYRMAIVSNKPDKAVRMHRFKENQRPIWCTGRWRNCLRMPPTQSMWEIRRWIYRLQEMCP